MSKFIRAIDLYCSVINWDNSIKNAFPEELNRWQKIPPPGPTPKNL